jgi:hypothetical protein
VAGVLLIAAVWCFAMAWRSGEHRHLVAFADPVPLAGTSASAAKRPVRISGASPDRRPVRVLIPAVGLSARVVPVGLTPTGHIKMPQPSTAGWYRWDSTPGAVGPWVLVGHVDSDRGPAVFYRLSSVRRGETVQMVRGDGSTIWFVISKVTVVSRADFPSQAVFGRTPRTAIRLITCTGAFDPRIGYADSLIVWGHTCPRC